MTVTFLTVGKPSKGWANDAVAHYTKFLSKYAQVSVEHIKPTSGRSAGDEEVCRSESARLLQRLDKGRGAVVVCDRRGTAIASDALAINWRALLDAHGGHATIVIGGACGVGDDVLNRADTVLSFGPMTLPHELALVVAMEQVARAFSILRGESYHK